MSPEAILGAWRLVSCTRHVEGGVPDRPLGLEPTGLILYTPDGLMSAFIQKDPAHRSDSPPFVAYAGRWEMAGDVLRHHTAFNTEMERAGQTLVRLARFEDGRFVLQTEKKQGRRGLSWMDFVWERY
jgi:hypothetical protein